MPIGQTFGDWLLRGVCNPKYVLIYEKQGLRHNMSLCRGPQGTNMCGMKTIIRQHDQCNLQT